MRRLDAGARVLGWVLAAGVGVAFLRGQTPPLPPAPAAGDAVLAAETQPGATQPATSQPATIRPVTTLQPPPSTGPTTGPAKQISLNFKDTPVDAVLDYLSEGAGFVIIKEAAVDGRITVQSKQPVTPQEAVVLLGAVLKATGHTAIQDGRVLRIMARDKAKKGAIPVHFGADPDAIDSTDELITQVIPIKNMDAAKLRQDMAPLIDAASADVAANEASNTIVITDTSGNIRRVARIISMLDRGESIATDIRMIVLKNANAATMAKLLTTVFKADPPSAGGNPQQGQPMLMGPDGRPMQPGGGGRREGRMPGGIVDQALRGGRVNAVADDRTNTLILTAPVEALKLIEGIVRDLDANPIPTSTLRAFPLSFAEAEATAKHITSLFGGGDSSRRSDDYYSYSISRMLGMSDQAGSSKVKVTATFDERTNTVLVTAPLDAMKEIENIIKLLDANNSATAEVRFYPLHHADAFDVAKLVQSTFAPEKKDSGNPYGIIFLDIGRPQGKTGPKVSATSDTRTNSVIVTAPSDLFKKIEEVINKLDTNPASEDALFIYKLRNGQAANLEVVMNVLFGNITPPNQNNNGDQRQQNGDRQGQDNGRGRNNGLGNGGAAGGNDDSPSARRRNARDSSRRGSGNNRNGNQLTPGSARAVTEMTGEVFVVADRDTNSLIVTTRTRYQEQVKKIIEELDRPVPQVLIKVLVAEVTHDGSVDYGMDFSVLNQRANGNGQTGGFNFGNAAAATASGGLAVNLLETNVQARLHALQSQGKLDVLSRPYILASDNQEANIVIGQEVPIPDQSRTTDLGGTVTNIRYREVGIILQVTPHINPDGLVILDVAPEISQLTNTSITINESVSSPVIASRYAESRVAIRNGETIVIGGLMEDRKISTVDKIPLLGDLPVLGPVFSRTRVTKSKTELLIFLTPHVAIQPEMLKGMSRDEEDGMKVTPNAVGPGVFDDHLRGLRRGATPPSTQPDAGPIRSILSTPATRPE